ncbi:MAG TPA: hypothetical protein VLA87_01045 [Gaiellaceae bacterium]|nr:hypothetical protein [Gaiellaceae bacterium]
MNVRRDGERLIDTGYLEVDGQTGEILFSAGPHPVRELLDGSFNINLALPGVRRHPPLAKHRARGSGPLPRAELQRLRTRTGIRSGVRR